MRLSRSNRHHLAAIDAIRSSFRFIGEATGAHIQPQRPLGRLVTLPLIARAVIHRRVHLRLGHRWLGRLWRRSTDFRLESSPDLTTIHRRGRRGRIGGWLAERLLHRSTVVIVCLAAIIGEPLSLRQCFACRWQSVRSRRRGSIFGRWIVAETRLERVRA